MWAWSVTSRLDLAALDGRLCSGFAARTWKGLSRIDSAWLAESKVAEVVALVLATAECLVANFKADVESFRVAGAFLDAAADLLAFVFFASLDLVANPLALEAGCFLLLLVSQ